MEQIASGAEEAAGAAQESLAAIAGIVGRLAEARERADASRQSTTAFQTLLAETGVQITSSVADLPGRSAITEQVEMGVAVRMACLDVLTRRSRGVEGWA